MSWFSRKEEAKPTEAAKPEFLNPGECECGHSRCCHRDGLYECKAAIIYDHEDKRLPKAEWGDCACQLYIPDDDDEGDDSPSDPIEPEVAELEKMLKR